MDDSILNSTKTLLGLGTDVTPFDTEIIIHINSVMMILEQLGALTVPGFQIQGDAEEWGACLDPTKNLSAVKSYVYLKVRLVFDPPATGFVLDALSKQIAEYEWRITSQAEPPIVEGTTA